MGQKLRVGKWAHKSLQHDVCRTRNENTIGFGDGRSHAGKFQRMHRSQLRAIQHSRQEAISNNRAMR
jgi:hypothetical protein